MTSAEKRERANIKMRTAYAHAMPQHLNANELEVYRVAWVAALKYATDCVPRVRANDLETSDELLTSSARLPALPAPSAIRRLQPPCMAGSSVVPAVEESVGA